MRLKVRQTGNWQEVHQLIKNLKPKILEGAKTALVKAGLEMEKFAVKAIQGQTLGWKNDPKYTEAKIKAGFSEKVLVKTSTYLQSINSINETKDGKFRVFVGIKKGIKDAEGNELVNIAAVLEFGRKSSKDSKKPLWVPTANHIREWIVTSKIFEKEIERELKKPGFTGSKFPGRSESRNGGGGAGPLRKDGKTPDKRFKSNRKK